LSRNGSGVYSVPNTFVSGNTITASGHNGNWTDIATEMTNSVAADGQTSMTGPLKAENGTVGSPAITFAADPDTGVYHIGANNLGVAANGAKVLDVSTTGLAVTGTVNSSGAVKQAGFALLPVGIIMPYAGTTAPSGYLFCFGQSVLRASYADLFTAIGTTYGSADGTHFTLPDLRGRAPFGRDDMGGSAASRLTSTTMTADGVTLGATGGAQTKTLLTANLPAYTPSGSLSLAIPVFNLTAVSGSTDTTHISLGNSANGSGGTFSSFVTNTWTGTAQGGISTPVDKMPPAIVLNYIIFAGI
jgi:microcystin-dependent protein